MSKTGNHSTINDLPLGARAFMQRIAATRKGTASGGIERYSEAGLDIVIWCDNGEHVHEVTQKLHRQAKLPIALPIYPLPTTFVAGDFDRVPDHCVPGPAGRIVVALG